MNKLDKLRELFHDTEDKRLAREIKYQSLMKTLSIIMVPPIMTVSILILTEQLSIIAASYTLIGIFIMSGLLLRPYIANLSALIYYVRSLSLDKRTSPPDLTFLNNVEELNEAIQQLHNSWEIRRNQLEANIAENRILIDSLPDIIIMLDKNYNIIRTNSTAREVFGDKLFNETINRLINDPKIKGMANSVMKTKKSDGAEYFLEEPFFRHYIVKISRFPIYSPGGIALIIVLHDITDQKKTELMLSDFVANASHEIRTPLTSLMGLIETIQTTARDDPEASSEFLKIMQMQADRMAKLVRDLLSLSQIERNVHTRPTERVSLPLILRRVRTQLANNAAENKMKIDISIIGKLPKITGDTNELFRVFENLIGNAIKYGRNGTIIKIEAAIKDNIFKEHKNLYGQDKVMAISISDEGDGIPPEHIPRLTERFYRVDSARSRKVGGTGLGLSIVKHILEHHRGALDIKSETGKGSVFTVLLLIE